MASTQTGTTMRPFYRVCRYGAQMLFTGLFRGRVMHTRRVPRDGGVLLVSNHQSFLDPVLATLAIPRECHYMARDSLFEQPQFRWLIEALNAFPVKRGTADTRAIKETIRRLRAGGVVLTFPEATRTTDGSIGPMRAGVVLIARKTRVPVVPTLILGAYESWPRSAKLPHPRPVLIAYGHPIYPHEHPEWSDEQCVTRVRDELLAMQRRYAGHPALTG
jgi:1-acyl-sn-glycerol-3-phosphate acyltransferase